MWVEVIGQSVLARYCCWFLAYESPKYAGLSDRIALK